MGTSLAQLGELGDVVVVVFFLLFSPPTLTA